MKWSVAILVGLILLLWALLLSPSVQTWLTNHITSRLAEDLNTIVHVDRVNLNFFEGAVIEGLYIEDQQGDTLLYAPKTTAGGLSLFSGDPLYLGDITVERPRIFIQKNLNDSSLNIQFLIDAFTPVPDTLDTIHTHVVAGKIELIDAYLLYRDHNSERIEERIDWGNLELSHLNISTNNLDIYGDTVTCDIDNIQLQDHSGFSVDQFVGKLRFDPEFIIVDETNLETGDSEIHGRIAFKYKDIKDFSDFSNKVKMNHQLEDSHLRLEDLSWFTKEFVGLDREVDISGRVSGRVSHLKCKDLDITIDDHTRFQGDVTLDGLPSIDQTFITLDINRLTSNKAELDYIPIPPFNTGRTINTPETFAELGEMSFEGNFIGFINDFTAYGHLTTEIGNVSCDITMHENDDHFEYLGRVIAEQFDLAKFYQNEMLGPLSADVQVSGQGLTLETADAEINGIINSLKFNGYRYKNIDVAGNFKNEFFNGLLSIHDNNLFMDFDGKIDFISATPHFVFDASIANIDLVDLNFLKGEEYTCLSGDISADLKGINLRDIQGVVDLHDVTYCTLGDECRLEHIKLSAFPSEAGKIVSFESSVASGWVDGDFGVAGLQNSILGILADWVPSFDAPEGDDGLEEEFDLRVTVHDYELINRFFTPQINVANGTYAHLSVHEQSSNFSMVAVSDSLRFEDIVIYDATLDGRRQDSAIYFSALGSALHVTDALTFDEIAIDGRTENDTILLATTWDSQALQHAGDINAVFTIRGNENFDILFNTSYVDVSGERWYFDPGGKVKIDSTRIQATDLSLFHNQELIGLSGIISEHPKSWMTATFQNFDLKNLNPFISDLSLTMSGLVNGEASIKDIYKEKRFTSSINVASYQVNQYEIGDIRLESVWDNANQVLNVDGDIKKLGHTSLSFGGYYDRNSSESPLNLSADMNGFELGFVNAFISEGVSDIGGMIGGQMTITGTPDHPELQGQVEFSEVAVKIDYLNTTYFIEEVAGIEPDMFTLDGIRLIDEEGNEGLLVGTIAHENFTEWSFDAGLYLDDEYLLCLNTAEEDNSLYYGKAYAKGDINVSSYQGDMEFEIALESGPGTVIAMPLGASEDVAFEDFVTFINTGEEIEKEVDLTGLHMNFQLNITPDAEFQIIFDEAVGDVLKGRGKGYVNLNISTDGHFDMQGDIEVVEGDYLFTLKNLINKDFSIRPGGNIVWSGDPLGAELNLDAIYSLSSPLKDILADNTGQYNKRTDVDLVMGLSGAMMNPNIHFDVELPNSDEITKSRVAAAISDEQERNRQAFSLLVMRRFVAPHGVTSNNPGGGVLAENSMEMLSAQVGVWLQGITDKFDIGFDYRPGDEVSNEEISLALSTQLFSDRLSLSGNFGVSQGNEANQNPSSIIGDLKLEYKMTEDGKIRMVVFNESNEYDLANTDQSAYTQGVGMLYKEEFNTIEEFYCGFKNLLRPKEDQLICDE